MADGEDIEPEHEALISALSAFARRVDKPEYAVAALDVLFRLIWVFHGLDTTRALFAEGAMLKKHQRKRFVDKALLRHFELARQDGYNVEGYAAVLMGDGAEAAAARGMFGLSRTEVESLLRRARPSRSRKADKTD
jgi:hypothetical protein